LPLNLSQSAVSSSIPFENLPYGSLRQEGKPIKPKYLITTILSKRLSGNCGILDGRVVIGDKIQSRCLHFKARSDEDITSFSSSCLYNIHWARKCLSGSLNWY